MLNGREEKERLMRRERERAIILSVRDNIYKK